MAPSAAGANSAPSRPSQPIRVAFQRVARYVAADADDERAGEGHGRRDELVDRAGDQDRAEQPGDADGGRGERGLGAVLVLAQPDARAEEAGGEEAGEDRARAFAEPTARDRDGEQEREPREDGDAAEPGEHRAAEHVLEIALRLGRPRAAR